MSNDTQDWSGRIQTITLDRLASKNSIAQKLVSAGMGSDKAEEVAAHKLGMNASYAKSGYSPGM